MLDVKISGFYDEVSSNLDEQINLIKDLGESYLCPRSIDGKNIADYTFEEFKEKIYPKLQENNIKFSSIGSPIGKVGINDEEGFEKQKNQLKELVKIAELMNCEYIRIFSFYYGDEDPYKYTEKVIDRLKEFLEIVKGTSVKLMHENEKLVYGDEPARVLIIKQNIDDPNFVFCFDASNYVQCNVDVKSAFDQLKDITVYYHIKDCGEYKVEVPVGLGLGCYDYIIEQLDKRDYKGFMTLEPHTWKYAIFKAPVNLFPFLMFFKMDYFKTFRAVDKKLGLSYFKFLSRKDVFVLQYNNLKKLLETKGQAK
ncbi:MAG: sugar phosphate isomerase/epimerase [Clostridia bacterium]|nr:sugar phosphate isomerase/epimerase [Clostridia bacterium]